MAGFQDGEPSACQEVEAGRDACAAGSDLNSHLASPGDSIGADGRGTGFAGAAGVQVRSRNIQVNNYLSDGPAGAGNAGMPLASASGAGGSPFQGHVFISYVREDSGEVDALQRMLEAAGIPVWRDTASLWPGEDWRARIRDAITREALVFVACFSSQSAARQKSYQNEEILLAVDQLRLRRPDVPWLIPVRFDDCSVPDLDLGAGRTLASIQQVNLFGAGRDLAARRLLVAVQHLLWHSSPSGGPESVAAVAAGLRRAAAASQQPAAPPDGPEATREPDLRDHARARKDAERLSGDAPRHRPARTRVGDKVAEELETLGPDQAALTIEYAGHPGRAEKLTVALTRMAPEAASATLCRVHARQVLDWLRYMHPYDPQRTVRVMELIGPRRLATMMNDQSSAEVDQMLARVPGNLSAAIRAGLAERPAAADD